MGISSSMTIFISGPMSGHKDFNYPAFHRAGEELKKNEIKFYSPVHGRFGHPRPAPTQETAKPWEYYMRQSLKQLLLCDSIYMLAGWEESHGARLENGIATTLGMTIYYQEHP